MAEFDPAPLAERCDARRHKGQARKALASCLRPEAIYVLLLILIACVVTKAAAVISLTEYRERIGQATIALDTLSSFDEGMSEREASARTGSTLREVRRAVPPKLVVEWNGAPTEVNNAWLDEALKEYEKSSTPPAGRDEALSRAGRAEERLTRITERLHALGERLDEVLMGKAGGQRSKDEEKARLASILRRSEYDKAAQESALARLWARIKRWLRSLFPKREPVKVEPVRPVPVLTKSAEIFVIALALAAIAYVAWKFVPRFLQSRGFKRREKGEARVVLGEHLAPDQTAFDILAEAERLARAGDIRGAIRKGYIALLCELGDRKILRIAQHKTNRDYLRAVADNRPLYGEMQLLTNSFENYWYGYAPGTLDDWAAFRLHYEQALEKQG
ncbi:MAG: DUF4129 domain-containing protein [Acidobacteria bacterium]|nr:DUF4129 domain-containing protein [Acidobacteriota bacterium]